jgi:hypothetical protein
LPFRERFSEDLVAPFHKCRETFGSLTIRLCQSFQVLALPVDKRVDVDARQLEFLDQLLEILKPGKPACV